MKVFCNNEACNLPPNVITLECNNNMSMCVFSEWQFGWLLCKLVPYLQAVAVSASVNTLTVIAVER